MISEEGENRQAQQDPVMSGPVRRDVSRPIAAITSQPAVHERNSIEAHSGLTSSQV